MGVCVVGLSLALGLAWWLVERDRADFAEAVAAEVVPPPPTAQSGHVNRRFQDDE